MPKNNEHFYRFLLLRQSPDWPLWHLTQNVQTLMPNLGEMGGI